jgi:streptomycin 6-kinase
MLLGVIDVPQTVRRKALAVGAQDWLDGLPGLVAALEQEWSFRAGRVYQDATEALVVEADGAVPAVLKLLVPRGHAASHEITVLALAGGSGCVRLLRHDRSRNALLLARLGRSMAQLDLPVRRRHELLCEAARRVWRPAPDCGLPTGADKGRWLADFVASRWQTQGRPCSRAAIDHALECAARRVAAHDKARAVLLHGDVHQWNALQDGDGFTLVDPDGLLAEPEYDLGVLMREDPVELMDGDPTRRARRLAAMTGLDPAAIWEWGVIERVSTGLLLDIVQLRPLAGQMLAAADTITADHRSITW